MALVFFRSFYISYIFIDMVTLSRSNIEIFLAVYYQNYKNLKFKKNLNKI